MNLPDISELIRLAVQYQLAHLHTCLPGEIVEYDPDTQSATVKPLLQRVDAAGVAQSLPEVYRVPVQFPRSQAASIAFKVQKGDPCLLLFAERGWDTWKKSGKDSPALPRQFSLTDAVAIPGVVPRTTAPANPGNVDLRIRTAAMDLQADGDTLTISAPKLSVTDGQGGIVSVTGGKLRIAGAAGDLIALLVQALQLAATGSTSSGPVSPNPGLASAIAQLQALSQ